MPMAPFYEYFPDVAAKEMRSVQIQGTPDLPDGEYGFLELYCNDPKCDCRRVLINVLRSDTKSKIWATINFGWESVAFYRRWLGNADDARECKGPSLDPLNTQTQYSPALLRLFMMIIRDEAYVQRLSRHYMMVKQALKTKSPAQPQVKVTKRPPRPITTTATIAALVRF